MLLRAENIVKRYGGVTALNHVDFDVCAGEVHGLVGVNGCGKSTLMKIIAGAEQATSGTIYIDDVPMPPYDTARAMSCGIGIIYQDLSLFPNLSVFENIYLPRVLASGRKTVSRRGFREGIAAITEKLGITLDLDADLGELPVARQQLVAIIRALFNRSRLIILDEPTTALTSAEIHNLFTILDGLRKNGLSFIFISHKLTEMLDICDRITVFRDGMFVRTFSNRGDSLKAAEIEQAMLGMNVAYRKFLSHAAEKPLLEVRNLTKANCFKDVSLTVHEGEILGIAGQLGSGRTELAKALFGAEPADSGSIMISGQAVSCRTISEAVSAGIAYVPEDRLHLGLVLPQSIRRNVTVCSLRRMAGRLGALDLKEYRRMAVHWLDELLVKRGRVSHPISSLSGGNQQKVVLAKWLAISPKLLILDSPTVGIDVGAKSGIYETVHRKAAEGMSFIMISDELPELLSNCDRIAIMSRGRIRQIISTADLSETRLAALIAAGASGPAAAAPRTDTYGRTVA